MRSRPPARIASAPAARGAAPRTSRHGDALLLPGERPLDLKALAAALAMAFVACWALVS